MRICFIWHMHQPYYKDLRTGEYLMPWVRLHGVKDYLDMVTILDNFPRLKQCFNLVPSLLEQIEDYVENGVEDRHLYLSRKHTDQLSITERREVIDEFFHSHLPTMIEPYPRYHQLWEKCRLLQGGRGAVELTDQELLDLQVWFNATWIDPSLRSDPRAKAVFERGRDFTEEQKQQLLDYQIEIMSRIIPAYRDRQERGQIEVSFSPYYHPILPLLCDSESAHIAQPDAILPKERFHHPEDARYHVRAAAELYRSTFGRERFGMWPSEGSVSEEILPILKENGVDWIATDEEVYYASINHVEAGRRGFQPEAGGGFHRPFLVGDGPAADKLGILFRDHRLSDKLGFVYSGWETEAAADDFVAEIHKLSRVLNGNDSEHVISIILDGENAWEHYQNDGLDFLTALYSKIESDPGIETVLPSEIFAQREKIVPLPYLFAGSWINHDFGVWIGHEEDNRAWDLLKTTRDKLVEFLTANPDFDSEKSALCWKEIYIAEGSDWCWWYGDDHHTSQFDLFDRLFRTHLQNVWEIINQPLPQGLLRPIRRVAHQVAYSRPSDLLTPAIDGRQTHFFEWYGAGRLECYKLGGSMHRAERKIYQLLFGYDHENLYFRVDFARGVDLRQLGYLVVFDFSTPNRYRVTLGPGLARFEQMTEEQLAATDLKVVDAWENVLEVSVPRSGFDFPDARILYFNISLREGEKEIEKWPETNYIFFDLPLKGESLFWQV